MQRGKAIELDDGDARAEIERLEVRIEELAERIAKCRKFILMSKLAMAAGAIVILAFILSAIRFDPVVMIAAITAVIGGTVLLGSNNSTLQEATSTMQKAEAQRAALIGQIELRLVEETQLTRTLH
jgi:hypothetical protein